MEPDWKTPPGTIIDGYDATPPSVNVKCIVLTIIVCIIYWFGKKKEIILPLCILGILFYDSLYSCNVNYLRSIIISIIFFGLLLTLPKKNKLVLLLFLYFPYLLLAIYDYQFDCKRNKLGPTFLANFYSWAKPAYSDQIQSYKNWHPKWKNLILKTDIIVFIISLICIYFFLNK
jgi:hypothetical protein